MPAEHHPSPYHLINRNSICGQLHSRTHYRRIDCTQHTMKRMNTGEGGEGERSELIKRTRWSNVGWKITS